MNRTINEQPAERRGRGEIIADYLSGKGVSLRDVIGTQSRA